MDDDNSGAIEIKELEKWFLSINLEKLNQTYTAICPEELKADLWKIDEDVENIEDINFIEHKLSCKQNSKGR